MNVSSIPHSGSTWYNWPGLGCRSNHQLSASNFSHERPYDVAIIGAGVIGCALSYVLSQYKLRLIVLDKAFDVGEGTSKGNSAIVHTGFDATPGSLESQLVTSASRQWPELAQKLKIPFSSVSALMLAFTREQQEQLPKLKKKALENGVEDVRLVTQDEVRRLEPHVAPNVLGGLLVPRESIADPFTTSVAYAEVAKWNGTDFAFGVHVERIDEANGSVKQLVTAEGLRIYARRIVNAAGFGVRQLLSSYGGERMDLNPRRGQFVIYDRESSFLAKRILLPIPTEKTKGMLVTPTIFGNLVAGPTAEDLDPDEVNATQTTPEGLCAVRESGIQMVPALAEQPIIATYAGLRCNCAQGSYWMRFNDGSPGVVTVAGIRSTGFTASISTAQWIVERLNRECDLPLVKNPSTTDSRPETSWPGWWRRPYEDPKRLANKPDYGRVVCSCENITRGEIQDVLDGSPGTMTLDGLKRRTRVLTGRCQGFNCSVPVAEMIARHLECPLSCVTKKGPGTEYVAASPPWVSAVQRTFAASESPLRSHYRVIIVGGGPAGMGAALGLAKRGIDQVLLIERASELGGIPVKYRQKENGIPTFVMWRQGRVVLGQTFVESITAKLNSTKTHIQLECQAMGVAHDPPKKALTLLCPRGKYTVTADAVVLACGARERTTSERGWVVGHRPARVFYTMQILQLLDGHQALPARQPAIIGSDLIAFSAAAKLKAAGAASITMTDHHALPIARLWEQLYFRRWSRPRWVPSRGYLELPNDFCERSFSPQSILASLDCDGMIVSGELVPNCELAVAAGLDVRQPQRLPIRHGPHALSAPGWFVAGAASVGFLGADASHRDGFRAAASVARYLASGRS